MKNAKEIRKELKENFGYNANMVSVRHSYAGYSESFTLTIKDINVDKKIVEDYALSIESIDRDDATGEILGGGNAYVNVELHENLINEISNHYIDVIPPIPETLNELEDRESETITINSIKFTFIKFIENVFDVIVNGKGNKRLDIRNSNAWVSFISHNLYEMGIKQ